MAVSVVTPPAAEPVTVEEAKAHLRVDHGDEDTLIGRLIVAAREHVEGVTGRRLVEQTLAVSGPRPDVRHRRIILPVAPVMSIKEARYLDAAYQTRTLDASSYVPVTGERPGGLELKDTASWPAMAPSVNAVTVEAVVGHPPDGADPAGNVPEALRHVILLLAAHWYEHRQAVTTASAAKALPLGLDMAITPWASPWHGPWTA